MILRFTLDSSYFPQQIGFLCNCVHTCKLPCTDHNVCDGILKNFLPKPVSSSVFASIALLLFSFPSLFVAEKVDAMISGFPLAFSREGLCTNSKLNVRSLVTRLHISSHCFALFFTARFVFICTKRFTYILEIWERG